MQLFKPKALNSRISSVMSVAFICSISSYSQFLLFETKVPVHEFLHGGVPWPALRSGPIGTSHLVMIGADRGWPTGGGGEG